MLLFGDVLWRLHHRQEDLMQVPILLCVDVCICLREPLQIQPGSSYPAKKYPLVYPECLQEEGWPLWLFPHEPTAL